MAREISPFFYTTCVFIFSHEGDTRLRLSEMKLRLRELFDTIGELVKKSSHTKGSYGHDRSNQGRVGKQLHL
jgi:hypothetical protein